MAQKEHFSFDLKCKDYGREGSVTYYENTNPVHSINLNRGIVSIVKRIRKTVRKKIVISKYFVQIVRR